MTSSNCERAPVGGEDLEPDTLIVVEQRVGLQREPLLLTVRAHAAHAVQRLVEEGVEWRALDGVQALQLARTRHVHALKGDTRLAIYTYSTRVER